MAFKEVPDDEAPRGQFFKFDAIGDKFGGYFVNAVERDGKFGRKVAYTFRDKHGVDWTMPNKWDLDTKLAKQELKQGNAVIIEYTSNLNTGKENPMAKFKVQIDREVTKLPPPAAPKAKEDDLPF
jgi:hypothetical protein